MAKTETVEIFLKGKDEASQPIKAAGASVRAELEALSKIKANLAPFEQVKKDAEAVARLKREIGDLQRVAGGDVTGKGGGLKSFLTDLRGEGGRRSTIGQFGQLFGGGGGALAGVSLIARDIGNAADKADELAKKIREGNLGWREMSLEIMKGLPVVGEFAKAGEKIREIFDTDFAASNRAAEAEKALSGVIDFRLQQLEKEKKLHQDIAREIQGIKDTTNLIGQLDPYKSEIDTRQKIEAGQKAAEDAIKAREKELLADFNKQAAEIRKAAGTPDQNAIGEARDTLAEAHTRLRGETEARQALQSLEQPGLAANSFLVALRRQQAEALETFTQDTNEKRVEQEHQLQRQLAEVELAAVKAREQESIESARRVAEAKAQIEERQLRRGGKNFSADLTAAGQRQAAQEAALSSRVTDQLQRSWLFGGPLSVSDIQKQADADSAAIKAGYNEDVKDAIGKRFVAPAIKSAFAGFDKFTDVFTANPAPRLAALYQKYAFPYGYNPAPDPLKNAVGLAGAVDQGQGSGFVRGLAEQLTLAQLGRDTPDKAIEKHTKKLSDDIADIKTAIGKFIATVGAAGAQPPGA